MFSVASALLGVVCDENERRVVIVEGELLLLVLYGVVALEVFLQRLERLRNVHRHLRNRPVARCQHVHVQLDRLRTNNVKTRKIERENKLQNSSIVIGQFKLCEPRFQTLWVSSFFPKILFPENSFSLVI